MLFFGEYDMDTPNFEDWFNAGLITKDELVEFRAKLQEILKAHPNLSVVEALSKVNNIDKNQTP